ncbi:hypothetical protein HDV03_003950 [Kappamyces sp. JEL0829]|nr:hypothetical protein HDV03_003950 [Kappamyces sp. JEL0829]
MSYKVLSIKVGNSDAQLFPFNPNDETRPFPIDTPLFHGWLQLRVKDFKGVVPSDCKPVENEEYFVGKRHLFSLHLQATFKQDCCANDFVWAWEASKPIKIPSLFVRFFSMIAPHAMQDLQGEKPYFQSYAITASSLVQTWNRPVEAFVADIKEDISSVLPSHLVIKAQKTLFGSEESHAVAARRKLFVLEDNRLSLAFKRDTSVAFETFNGFFDPNTFHVRIPGISYDLNHILDGQPLRIYLRSRDATTQYACIELSIE